VRKQEKKCPTEGCWESTPGGRFCGACASWWRRTSLYTATELHDYLSRLDRFAGRSRLLHHRKRRAA
jgi:hypothetical protein